MVNLGGLTPGTLYHCRISATNTDGTTNSSDGTFTTGPSSIENVSKANIKLYPNPAGEEICV